MDYDLFRKQDIGRTRRVVKYNEHIKKRSASCHYENLQGIHIIIENVLERGVLELYIKYTINVEFEVGRCEKTTRVLFTN